MILAYCEESLSDIWKSRGLTEKINDTYQVDVNLRFYETSSQEDETL